MKKQLKEYFFDKKFDLIKGEKSDKGKYPVRKDNLLLAKTVNIGYYLVTPLVVGVFAGVFFDKFFKTKSIFTLIFLVLGVIATFYNLGKIIKEWQ